MILMVIHIGRALVACQSGIFSNLAVPEEVQLLDDDGWMAGCHVDTYLLKYL